MERIVMKDAPIFVRMLKQKDNHTFTIEWSDGMVRDYRLSELQFRCPCAKCYDVVSGTRLEGAKKIDPDVRATIIKNVGRYALQIKFTSGCSTGIYSFGMLRGV